MGQVKLELGDCLDVLRTLDDASIDAVVTDPPYGLSFMGKAWDYDVPSVAVWQEVLRVLKPGGYLLSFAGTRTQHRMACAIEDAGFEIRDMIAWVYGSGFPKSLNIGKAVDKLQGNERETVSTRKLHGKARVLKGGNFNGGYDKEETDEYTETKGTSEWEGWGTALKPALEPITVARKPLDGTVVENCLKWGVGGIDIDGSRVGTEVMNNAPAGNKAGGSSLNMSAVGMPQDVEGTTATGRFPANLIHDGSEEVVGLFPNDSARFFKSIEEYTQKCEDIRNEEKNQWKSLVYRSKASKSERNMGCEGMEEKKVSDGREIEADNAFQRGKTLRFNTHPTVKPIALMEYLVKLVSREGRTILDPFMGSGSTGIACAKTSRNFIGIEREAEYLEIAKARIAAAPQRLL